MSQTLEVKLEWSRDSTGVTELPSVTAIAPRFLTAPHHGSGHTPVPDTVYEGEVHSPTVLTVPHHGSDHTPVPHTVYEGEVHSPTVQRFRPQDEEESTLLEKWEGFVTEIHNDGFWARMSANRGDYPTHKVCFEFDELGNGDRSILAVGIPVVWSIIRERRKGGIRRSSILYLRRIAAPEQPEITAARKLLDEWIEGSE